MTKTEFEAGKIYKVTFPDGSILIIKLIGGPPPKFQINGGSMIGIEWLEGCVSAEEIDDELKNM